MSNLAVTVSPKNIVKTLLLELSPQVHDKTQAFFARRQVNETDIIKNFYTHSAYDPDLLLDIRHYATNKQQGRGSRQSMPVASIHKVLELTLAADSYSAARHNFAALAMDEETIVQDLYNYIAEQEKFPVRLHIPNTETMLALESRDTPKHYRGDTSSILSMMLQDADDEI